MIGFTTHWNHYLDAIPAQDQDLYFREEYVRLYETEAEQACCFVYKNTDGIMLFPFLRRAFEYKGKRLYDFETAYGYGGPVSSNHSEQFMSSALRAMTVKAIEEGYVSGFVRFHPLLENWKNCETVGKLIKDRKTIAIDLTEGIEAAWMNEIHTKNRNVIKKGEKNGLDLSWIMTLRISRSLKNCTTPRWISLRPMVSIISNHIITSNLKKPSQIVSSE